MMSTFTTYFNVALKVLATSIREEKDIKGIQTGKEVKLSLFADDMIAYIDGLKDATRKLLELINEFGKVAGSKINTQKSVVFLYTNNERLEREIQEAIMFAIASKSEISRKNLPKETEYLYAENHKTLMKKIKDDTNGKIYHVLGLQESIL